MTTLKSISLVFAIPIIYIAFLSGSVILGEGYNFFDPYADTEFAPDYTPEKFKTIKEGMSEKEIRKIVGEPLSKNTDTTGLTEINFAYYYTSDGYLSKRHDKKFSLAGDLAWYGSSVEFNKDSIAIRIFAGWYYD